MYLFQNEKRKEKGQKLNGYKNIYRRIVEKQSQKRNSVYGQAGEDQNEFQFLKNEFSYQKCEVINARARLVAIHLSPTPSPPVKGEELKAKR